MSDSSTPTHPQQWPESTGAVQAVDSDGANAADSGPELDAEGDNGIQERKEKAREAIAGIDPAKNVSNGTPQANGGLPTLSKKRSRDGTQLPISQTPASDDGAKERQRLHNEILLHRYLQRDLMHGVAMNDQAERSRHLVQEKERERTFYVHDVTARRRADPGSVFGYGFAGYGNGTTNARTQIVTDRTRDPPRGRRCREVHISRQDNTQQADQHEELVPIRLDIELDKLRLRDTFTWNLHEKTISQDQFADYLVEDLKIPPEAVPEVTRQVKVEMQDQIQNYYPHVVVEDDGPDLGKRYTEYKDDEMRIQIKLNITIGRITLLDQFEWDINSPLNSPEEFARQMAQENALSGEFTTAIAHSIREQSQLYTKSLYLTNHPFDGRPIEDPELKDNFLPAPIHSAFRPPPAQKDYTPYMYEMSEVEFERTELSMMREHRAQKRQLNRRGGPARPDLKDRQRTLRSLLVHSVIPGAVETLETTGILKTRRSGRGGRRTARVDGDVDSDELDSDESGPESPAPSAIVTGGTARTRNMRGAASAATAAMRALGRSGTPDSQLLQAHDTRTSGRRSLLRDESLADADETLIVKLKINRSKYKHWWEDYQAKKRAKEFPLSGYASQPPPPATFAVQAATPVRGAQGTPATTPKLPNHARGTPQPNGAHSRASSTSARQTSSVHYDAKGGVDMDVWPSADDSPTAIQTLRDRHPDDNFVPLMRPYCVSADSGDVVKAGLHPGDAAPPGRKLQYLPRIRCNDCPGRVYTAQLGKVVEDFGVHLRNRTHRETVARRREGR